MARPTDRMRVGVLASGTGSNFAAILAAVACGDLDIEPVLLVCNRPSAGCLRIAEGHDVPTKVVDHRLFDSRGSFEAEVVEALRRAGVELVVMAGFDRLVTSVLLDAFAGRVVNIHPALLPSFKGTHGQKQAAEYGVRITGATVHFVDQEVDHGPIIAQAAVAIDPSDDADAVAAKILQQEHRLYPMALQLIAEGRVRIQGRKVLIAEALTPTEPLFSPAAPPAQRTSR